MISAAFWCSLGKACEDVLHRFAMCSVVGVAVDCPQGIPYWKMQLCGLNTTLENAVPVGPSRFLECSPAGIVSSRLPIIVSSAGFQSTLPLTLF